MDKAYIGVLLCIDLVVIGYCIVLVLWEAPHDERYFQRCSF
jgi:hypothetical protein